jgi:hypothetical protein
MISGATSKADLPWNTDDEQGPIDWKNISDHLSPILAVLHKPKELVVVGALSFW